MTSRLRTLAGNAALAAVSVSLACGAGEVLLRLFRPQPLEAAYVWTDGTLRHLPSFTYTYSRRGFSNRVRFNALGLRGPEVPAAKEPGRPRLLFLGDSFVEGKQVAENEVITAVLQRAAAEAGRPLEVINAGVAGSGTAEELILWRRLGRSLAPDLVLVGFYPNDVRNNVERGLFALRAGRAVAAREPKQPGSRWLYDVRKSLAARSHLYVLAKQGKKALSDWWSGRDAAAGAGGAPAPLEAEEVFAREPSPEVAHGWDLTLALLETLREEVESAGAAFVVAVFPTRFQVDDLLWATHAGRVGLDPAAFDLRAPQRILGEWARRCGAPTIDLLEAFRERNRDNSFYFEVDAHWNPDGHRLAALRLLDQLTALDPGGLFDLEARVHILPAYPREFRPAPEVPVQ